MSLLSMENATVDGWTHPTLFIRGKASNAAGSGYISYKQFVEYKVFLVLWEVLPPPILVLGTFGNLATILVMSRIKGDNSSQYVVFMVLALADLCVLYSGLFTQWLRYYFHLHVLDFHTVLCKLQKWAVYASGTTSAWLVTTVTVQRTMAVLWPHRMRVMCTVRRTWIAVAVVVATASAVHLHTVIGFYHIEKNYCGISGKYKQFLTSIWTWVDMCMSSFLPSLCLIVCSVILSWTLLKSTSLSSTAASNVGTAHSSDVRMTNAMKVTVTVLALSCTFLLLTLPVCVYLLWFAYGYVYTPQTAAFAFLLQATTKLTWYSNSAVNFILYCITGARFRKEFLILLPCWAKSPLLGEKTTGTSSRGRSDR